MRNFYKTPFLQNNSGRLLLLIIYCVFTLKKLISIPKARSWTAKNSKFYQVIINDGPNFPEKNTCFEQNLLLVKFLRAALKRPIQNSVKNLRLSALAFNYFPKRSILDVWQGSKFTSGHALQVYLRIFRNFWNIFFLERTWRISSKY